jgi:hypothetical protein
LVSERDEGDDIDNWSLESLIDVVKSYKKDNPDPTTHASSNPVTLEDSDEENLTDNQSKM